MKKTFYVYSPSGLLINRVSYRDLVEKYGSPIASSSNGQFFIFKKQKDEIKTSSKTDREKVREYMTLYIFHLSVFKFTPIKKINIIENMIEELDSGNSEVNDSKKVEGIKWVLNLGFRQITESIHVKCIVNDNMAVCVRIREVSNQSRQD